MTAPAESPLLPHGGFEELKSFQLARLIFDVTTRFAEMYIDAKSRTRDQMTQAARSGVQNIAEGSEAAATSRKTELKLTNVARASLVELKLDYQDFLRQHELPEWDKDHPALLDFKRRRVSDMATFRAWVNETRETMPQTWQAEIVANGALSLLNLTIYLLMKQIEAQAATFEEEGGFSERLYRTRQNNRRGKK